MQKDLSISQNFLVDPNFVEKLINSTSITNSDLVIEIGSGKGIITEALSKIAKEVIAIEFDPTLASSLNIKFKDYKNVKVVNENFLKFSLPNKPFKVFSNPPFNLSADILNKLLRLPNSMNDAYLILQDKTVERFSETNNQIAVLLKPFYEVSVVQKVNKNEFKPVPKVDIVFAKFEKRKVPMVDINNYQLYRDFVTYCFNQWKPTLLDSVGKIFTHDQIKIISKRYNLNGLMPSDVEIKQWINLFESFLKYVSTEKQMLVKNYESRHFAKQKDMTKRHRTNI